LFVLIAEPFSN